MFFAISTREFSLQYFYYIFIAWIYNIIMSSVNDAFSRHRKNILPEIGIKTKTANIWWKIYMYNNLITVHSAFFVVYGVDYDTFYQQICWYVRDTRKYWIPIFATKIGILRIECWLLYRVRLDLKKKKIERKYIPTQPTFMQYFYIIWHFCGIGLSYKK